MRRAGALEVDKLVEPALSCAMLGHRHSYRSLRTGMEKRRREEGGKVPFKQRNFRHEASLTHHFSTTATPALGTETSLRSR